MLHKRLEKLSSEELHDFQSSANIIQVVKSRTKRWTEQAALTRTTEMYTGTFSVILKERGSMENPDIDEGIILNWLLKK
jgi:hypothetical protein